MDRKKWIGILLIGAILAISMLFIFNYVVDPFGVFGDKYFDWYSYNIKNNPRVAKIAYLDKHHEKYDSYIIGGSKGSSVSPELMNEYNPGTSHYNMMMYGGDFYDYEKTIHYLVENYEVKNIVIHMSMHEIGHFNKDSKVLNTELSYKVNDKSLVRYYLKYLSLNLKHGFDKIEGAIGKTRGSDEYDTFIPETGSYNKETRDAEELGTLEEFLEKYPDFDEELQPIKGTAINKNVESVKRVKDYLKEHDVNFTFIAAPTYHKEMDRYDKGEIAEFWKKLADVTEFWDFTGYNTESYDARNFYDNMHYRNSMGEWVVHRIHGNDELVPEDFGRYTTKENVDEHLREMYGNETQVNDGQIRLPVVMYHHLLPEEQIEDESVISVEQFEEDLKAYKLAGYETISVSNLINYTEGSGNLPDKPLLITFDDGYLSNYQYAYPLLKKYDMKALISIIGWSVGETKFKGTDKDIIPHFDYNQAKEMMDSGYIDIGSHSYDLHQVELDGKDHRQGVLQKKNEDFIEYMKIFKEDSNKMKNLALEKLNHELIVFTYPYGFSNKVTEKMLKDLGYKSTITIEDGVNTITRDPNSLYNLKRVNRDANLSSEDLIESINKEE